jgi:GntR family transcriptional repressor for pyruvate dehydrogenase complex
MNDKQLQKLPDKVYAQIVASILRGEVKGHGKLPSEAELADRFGVSRPTVREALFRLRSDGIIASRRGSGSYVVRRPEAGPSQLIAISSMADIQRFYSFRICIEAGAAGLAAEMHDPQDLDAITSSYDKLAKTLTGGAPSVEEDAQFHFAVARASHNQFFISTIENIVGPIRQCMELSRNLSLADNPERRDQVRIEHQAIVNAIAKRSSEEASEMMRLHISNARHRIFEETKLDFLFRSRTSRRT